MEMSLIDACREIVREKQAGLVRPKGEGFEFKFTSGRSKKGWSVIDLFSAGVYVQVYDKLSDENRAKLSEYGVRGLGVALKAISIMGPR